MSAARSCIPPAAIGEVIRALAAGRMIASRHPGLGRSYLDTKDLIVICNQYRPPSVRVPLNDRTDMTTVLDRFRLDDKVAIVTGASSGLGVAFAQALAEAGADLVQATRAIVAQAGRRAITVAADVALPENAPAAVGAAITAFGHVDVLVNNAGKGTAVPATREAPAQFREVIDINLNGCY